VRNWNLGLVINQERWSDPPGSTAFLLLEVDSKFTGSNLHGFGPVKLQLWCAMVSLSEI
jgi:hypothetical protein